MQERRKIAESPLLIGYCTNVHPGAALDQLKSNLLRHAVAVRDLVAQATNASLPVGLWISDTVSQELLSDQSLDDFRDWLAEHRLVPYTLNGFPFNDFHQDVVKHDVYLPTWADQRRLDYTIRLAQLLHRLLPQSQKGTISSLPIGWPLGPKDRQGQTIDTRFFVSDQQVLKEAASNLKQLVFELSQLETSTGRRIEVCLEPEPGCLLDTADDLALFFRELLLSPQPNGDRSSTSRVATLDGNAAAGQHSSECFVSADQVRRHLCVCHDVCHSAVMFESQREAIEVYRQTGIRIGKLQVSAAIEAQFQAGWRKQVAAPILTSLEQFSEPRYLHQTSVQFTGAGLDPQQAGLPQDAAAKLAGAGFLFEDLSNAIAWVGQSNAASNTLHLELAPTGFPGEPMTWRTHFHVPIFLSRLGLLQTTRDQIAECLDALGLCELIAPGDHEVPVEPPHIEVETYAWNVLPDEFQVGSLAEGIAQEIQWLRKQLHQ